MKLKGMENGMNECQEKDCNHKSNGLLKQPSVKTNRRKLVLHFDIRNTVLVADSVTNIRIEQALNSYLTGVTWGRENPQGSWEWLSEVPSTNPPCPDAITYYKYREKELVKVPSDRSLLRQATGDFTFEPIGNRFYSYFKKTLSLLEWPHTEVCPDPKLTMQGRDGLYHYILPSFFKLLQHLHDTDRDFSIILRTYGMDAPNVMECIDYSLKGNHPRFKDKQLPYHVNTKQGKILRKGKDSITLTTHDGKTCLSKERDIYDYMSNSSGILGFVDDFSYWQDNDYSFLCSKPHWVDPLDNKTQHIFFDDNLRVREQDSIVNVRMLPPSSSSSSSSAAAKDSSGEVAAARSLNIKETTKLENVCLVLADLLESADDLDYFIKKVNACEAKYEEYLTELIL